MGRHQLEVAIAVALASAAPARADTFAGGATVTLPAAHLRIQLPDGAPWSIEPSGADDLLSLTGTSLQVLVGHVVPGRCVPPPASIGAKQVDPPPYLAPGSVAYALGDRVLACWDLAGSSFVVATSVPADQVTVAQTLIASLVTAATPVTPPPPVAPVAPVTPVAPSTDPCDVAVDANTRDANVDEKCLASSPHVLAEIGTGYGGSQLGSTWSYYGGVDLMFGPIRVEGRGRTGFNSPWFDGLVGYRIGYHYGPGTLEFLSYAGHDAGYNYYRVHNSATMVRSETLLVAGMRGMYLYPPGGVTSFQKGLDFGKTFEAGIQHYVASGLHTHERLEALAVMRDGKFGGETIVENDWGRMVYGVELGYVPYSVGTSSGSDYYFAINIGVAVEL